MNATKSFNILANSLSVLNNYFDGPNKMILYLYLTKIFRFFSKTVLSV